MVLSPSKFQSLSVRPPTPPKDIHDSDQDAEEVLDFLKDPFGMNEPVAKLNAAKALLNTPQTSPSSESGDPLSSARSSSRKKKVNFETQPCVTNGTPLPSQSFIPLHSSPLRPLPQTRVSKPLKSILKPSDAASTPPPADEAATPRNFESFAEMLESIMKQLASQTRSSRFDAYHSLQQAMQRYEKTPDTQALVDKMGLLTQFIQRDMHAIGINGTSLDSQLIGQALKFLMALVRIADVRHAMPDEFCTYVVDRVIQVAADASLPKVIINTHLAVLMQQNFRSRTMTPARVERILDVLDTIEERVSGLSVQAYRVRIYKKLIMQRPEVMAKHTERWIKHTLSALLSTLKDINQSALDTTISAAKAFGNNRNVIKMVLSVLNRVKSDGETVAHGMVKQLQKLLGSDHAAMVPQIWSAATALIPGCLDKNQFSAFAQWLTVFQMCFNSNKEDVKAHANIALGFLVYAAQLKENTTTPWSKMLIRIPQSQLEIQRGQTKKSDRESATSAYLALLYHALGPTASYEQLDRYWSDFVADFWRPLIRPSSAAFPSSPRHAFAACRVVSALLNGTRKPCDPQRTLDLRPQAMLQRDDLPSLDPRWVRKSISSILEFAEILVDVTPWTAEDCKDEPVKTMWLSLLTSLNTASSQEVMASNDSKDAMAHLVNFLRRMWDAHTAQLALSQQKEDSWADKFCFLLESVVEKLGAARFSDKCLTRNGQEDFEVAATPSHRSRAHGLRTSPLLYFMELLVNQSEGKLSESLRLRAVKVQIRPCFEAQNSRLSRLEMLRDCALLVDATARTPLSDGFWSDLAGLATTCITELSIDPKERGSRQFGKEYDIVVELLSLGFPYLATQKSGERLLICFIEAVRSEAGEGAVVLAVVEKVSESIVNRTGPESKLACLPFLIIILRRLPTSIARRTIEQGRQTLWPSSSNLGKTMDFDPYNHLYDAIVSTGFLAYEKLNADDATTISNFLEALGSSIRQCPLSLVPVYLRKLQETIRLWVEDSERKLESKTSWVKDVHTSVLHLWQEVCAAIYKLPRNNPQILLHLESLFTSGFVSRRRGIVDSSIVTWNATFGREQTLTYPPRLAQALHPLRSTVELSLPGFEVQDGDDEIAPSFYQSDSNMETFNPKKTTPRVKETPFKVVKTSRQSRSKSRSPLVASVYSKKSSIGRTPKCRLRHENSQLEFEPIDSSPSNPNNQESQILTERQREVYERQTLSSNAYADMRSTTPPPEPIAPARSPLEFHSDAISVDELPAEASRTPLRSVRALGPMDVFVGSSPTPQARPRSQETGTDRSSLATPLNVRAIELAHEVIDLGSSPPQFEKDTHSSIRGSQVKDSMEGLQHNYHEGERRASVSFDDGTTIDESAFLTGTPDEDPERGHAQEPEGSDMPSSTLDLQLTAQLDAEIQAQKDAAATEQPQEPLAHSEQRTNEPNAEGQAEGEETEIDLPTTSVQSNTETSDTSRVGDSFTSQAAEMESSQLRSLRRSHRQSSAPSPQSVSAKKGKPSSGRGPGRPRKIRPASPFPMPTGNTIIVPDTARVRGIRRSASSLSQVEIHSEGVVVEDTPAPKRVRRNIDKDVSEAKHNTPTNSQQRKTKRLSHVQATPKHSNARSSSAAVEEANVQPATSGPAPAMGEQNANVARQLPDTTPVASPGCESQSQVASNSVATPSRSIAERVMLTPRSIIDKLKEFKNALFGAPQLALNRQEEREADDLMFEIRRSLHAAGARGDQ
ncbi:hypothetical protein BU23DRAFT_484721 [Bimuria novae-zelandiae CBS 107.79]|uniref:Telomere-associated protein Rif1 N-terminal domain-containing protein n=1 Tax=Bimuria novae-zelandiae CBS 107.79 TaxID=1447943 RepID=A0A6A5UQF8_9PLEO|nr:hypothetical protein BU23DRAFT_484721 [Bimuria novae-zelandiae CBS 107.79]